VGSLVDSYRRCDACALELEQYCQHATSSLENRKDTETGALTYGGYSNHKVIRINPDGSVPRDVLQAHHAMLFWHRRLEGRRSVVEVLRLPLQDLLLTPERRAIANASPG
jgi:hypothetical protein